MSDEKKVSAETTEAPETVSEAAPKKKHWPIVISVLAVIVIAVLVAFLHWHEEPSFCNTFCHQPMDYYVEGYYSEDPGISAANHAAANVTCLGCHWSQAKMLDLVHEVVLFATDGFTNPLPDQKQFVTDEFCGGCHDGVTAPSKDEATAGEAYNPHDIPAIAMHEGIECGDCHRVHKQSVFVCASCHTNIEVPENWAKPAEFEAQAATASWPVDPQTGAVVNPHDVPADDTHAGILCGSCHDTNTFVCASCHTSETVVSELPEGWTVPEENAAQAAATEATPMYDYHSDMYVAFSPMHETAGAMCGNETDSDLNLITCADCHTEKVLQCAMCHLNAFEGNLPEGWSLPEHAMDVHGDAAATDEADDADAATDAAADDAVTAEGVADGEYTASGKGIGGDVPVTVTVKDGKITDVTVGDNAETAGIGTNAIEQLPSAIVEANGTNVDNVSGATITSKAIKAAVEEALAQGK